MTISAINSVNSNYKFNAPAFTSEPEKTEDKKEIGNTGKALILTGLAALAATGIYLATRGRSGSKTVTQTTADNPVTQGVSDEVKALKEKIATLKDSIKTKYSAEREKIDDAVTLEIGGAFHTTRGYLDKIKGVKDNKARITTISDYDKLIKYIQNEKLEDGKSILDHKKDVANYHKQLKVLLKELSSDEDWIYLRKLRHQINNKNIKNNDDFCRLQLINEVLFSKANKTTSPFLRKTDISLEEAIKLIKNSNTNEEFTKIITNSNKTYSTEDIHALGQKIETNELFNGEIADSYLDIKNSKERISRLSKTIKNLTADKQNYQQKVIDLANTTRQSAKVKELKKLVAKLKELEK